MHQTAIAVVTSVLVCSSPLAGAKSATLFGIWQLNNELTAEVQDTRSGPDFSATNVQTTVAVGGIPLPTGRTRSQGEYSSIPSRDPDVLRCAVLTIEPLADDVLLTYQGVGSETLKKGNVQGTRTSWSKRKLTTRYATTSRKVSRTFEVQSDGRLLVTVKLNPNRAKAAVHKRIFAPVE